ncbi:MAG: hypothetical protein IJ025_06160 [Clostridia bacterium]|nr:hypothetical protein [Clostridia bacterium]
MTKRIIAILLVISTLVLFGSCQGKNNDETTESESYVLPTKIIDADISLPYTSSDSLAAYSVKGSLNKDLIPVVYESLFIPSDDGKGVPQIAKNAEIDGKKVTVNLRTDVKFSNGTKLTSEHVKASFSKALNNAFYKSSLKNIASVSVKDDKTIVFTLSNPDGMVLNTLDFPVVLISGKNTLGSGKYRVEYLDETAYLQVNTHHREYKKTWHKQIALFDMSGISGPVYPFKANEISVYKQDLSDGAYTNLSSLTVSQNTNNLVYIGVNSVWSGSITSLDWVRQAINIGISRSSVTATSFLGQGTATVTPFKNNYYQINTENLASLSGETERAIAILERNGYEKVNSDGIRTNGANLLKLNILVCSENPYKVSVAQAVKKSLEELGFGVTITEKKTSEDFINALKEGHFGLYIGETQLTSNCDLTEFFTEKGVLNYGISGEFYEEFKAYKSGVDSTMTFVEAFSTEVPFIPLYYRKAVVSVNPNITGVKNGVNIYADVCEWKLNENK